MFTRIESSRTLLQQHESFDGRSADAPALGSDEDGDYLDSDMVYLPTHGTDGRVVHGTRCGGGNQSSCGNITMLRSPSPPLVSSNEPPRIDTATNQFPLAVTIVLLLVPVLAVAILLTFCYLYTTYRRNSGTIRRHHAESATLAFLAAMEARGTPMPSTQPVPAAPTGIPCLCVQPDKNLALALHEVPPLSQAIDALAPESGVQSTLVSVDLRNGVILEDHEGHTPPQLGAGPRSLDSSNFPLTRAPSDAPPSAAAHAQLDTTPTGCSIELPVVHAAASARCSTVLGSPVSTSVRSAGSGRHITHTPDATAHEPIDIVSLHHSARHRNPYAFMLDRGLQDPAHWSGDMVASRGSVRGLLNLGATILSSRGGSIPHWQQDAIEWAAVEVPVYRAYISQDLAKWLGGRLCKESGGASKLTAGLLLVLTGGLKPSSCASAQGMQLGSVQSFDGRSWSHNGVHTMVRLSSVDAGVARRALSMSAAGGRPAWRLNGRLTSWSAATAAGSPVLLSGSSVRSGGGTVTPAAVTADKRLTSDDSWMHNASVRYPQSRPHSQGMWFPMSSTSAGAPLPAALLTQNKVLRMSDLGEYGGGDEQEHIASGQWVPPPPVVACGLQCGTEVPWADLSLLPPEGMVPVSAVASGAVSQPWLLYNSVENALGGCTASHTSQGRSLCGMATVFESPHSGSEHVDETLESLRGRSDLTANSNGSNGAGNSASAEREAAGGEPVAGVGEQASEAENAARETIPESLSQSMYATAAHSAADAAEYEANAWKQLAGSLHARKGSIEVTALVTCESTQSTPHEDGHVGARCSSGDLLPDERWLRGISDIAARDPHASCAHVLSPHSSPHDQDPDYRNQEQTIGDTQCATPLWATPLWATPSQNSNDVHDCVRCLRAVETAAGLEASPPESLECGQSLVTADGKILLDLADVVGAAGVLAALSSPCTDELLELDRQVPVVPACGAQLETEASEEVVERVVDAGSSSYA